MTFLHPNILWLLIIPISVAIYQVTKTDSNRSWLTAGLRFFVLSLMVIALARPCLLNNASQRAVAVVDCSPSMKPVMAKVSDQLKSLVDRVGIDNIRLVAFGRDAREVKLNEELLSAEGLMGICADEPGSDPAKALELAAALCPSDGEIVLFSDGRSTAGDMVDAAKAIGRRGLTLKCVPLGSTGKGSVLKRPLRVPASAAVGEAVTITALVEAASDRETTVTLTDDTGKPLVAQEAQLKAGVQEVAFQVHPNRTGFQHYTVSLDDGQSVGAGLLVKRAVVGVLESAPETPSRLMLGQILGANAEVRALTVDQLSTVPTDLDVIVLADIPIAELGKEKQLGLRSWVENGGGLLVTGGRNAFGPGGYETSQLAPILPLRFPQKKEVRDPSTAVAVIIDTSGSMGGEGVSLAQEVARLALKRLKPHDKAGIVEFHGAKRWAAPMQPASNIIAIQRALNRLSAGGGTVMLPAIEEAYYGLMNVRTRTKHVLLLTDGGVETGAYDTLIRSMADDKIHVSTVLVGPRAGSGFLARLANWGKGQFYTAPSRFKLPEVIFKQPSNSLMKPFIEKEMQVQPVTASELTKDFKFDKAPKVKGYVRTEPKETAEVLLRSEIGDPILARWHYGLGRTAILTSRLGGGWSKDFLNWSKSRDLLASLIRQLRGVSLRQPVDMQLAWSAKGVDVMLHALSTGPGLVSAPVNVSVKDKAGQVVSQRIVMPSRANQWFSRFDRVPAGDYVIEVGLADEGKMLASGGIVVPPAVEFAQVGINEEGLTAAAQSARDAATAVERVPFSGAREIWQLCAAAALVCFILMILVRRLPRPSGMVPPQARAAVAAIIVAGVVLTQSASADSASKGPRLNIFLKMRVAPMVIMKDSAKARKELKDYLPKIIWKHKNLAPLCNYLRSQKKTSQGMNLLALALTENGDYDEAVQVLNELAKRPVVDPWVYTQLLRVRELAERKKYKKVKRYAAPTELTAPEKAMVDEIAKMNDLGKAREALNGVCERLFLKYGDLKLLCKHLEDKNDVPTAAPLLAQALATDGEIRAAAKILEPLAAKPDADFVTLSTLGRIREMLGQKEVAILYLKRALKKTTNAGVRFALRIRLAQLYYDGKDRDAARKALRAIVKDPAVKSQEGSNYCARIAGLNDDFELVAELFKPTGEGQTLRRNLLYMGETLMRLHKPAEARQQFEAALGLCKVERDRRYVLDKIVVAAREMKDLSSLMDQWLKAERIFPEQLDILAGILGGELDRTEDLLSLLDREDMPLKTQKLIRTPAFQERLAMLAAETGKSALARRTYSDLAGAKPKDPFIRDGYVRLLLMEGDVPAAKNEFRKAISRAEDADEVLSIAASARALGLKEVAIGAVEKAKGMDRSAHLGAALFMADLYRDDGETDKALDIIRGLEKNAKKDDRFYIILAQAYERHGYPNDAIRILKKVNLKSNEKALFKLIALLEEQNRNSEVFERWKELWSTATEKMAVIQANDKLLDIGSKSGKLVDLVVDLEEKLDDKGKLSEREETLLLDIYTSVNDPVSAADILMELSEKQGGASVDTYKRLLRVYMECELFGRCKAILNKLIEIDPKNAEEHLQTLVLIALERKNEGDALVVLEQMKDESKDGILRDSFSASVLTMIGRHNEAAQAYRRTLASNPDEVETWLLWGNALLAVDAKEREEIGKTRGRRPPRPQDQAGNRRVCGYFSMLLENAQEDDLFTIALDGLLNAAAPAYALENGLRRLNERIAADPHNFHLYRLAADLNEEMRRMREVERILGQGLIVADDGRSIVMRELIAMAKADKRDNDVIAYGRSLLNVAAHLPPGECLSLGTTLLEKGYSAEADQAFQRVLSDRKAVGAARSIVERFENVGLFGKAGKVIRTLLIEKPYSVELLLRLGLIEEKNGNFNASSQAYGLAANLMIGRMPSLKKSLGEKSSGRRREKNVTDVTQYLAPIIRGLIVSARTPDSQRKILGNVEKLAKQELKRLEARSAFADTLAENPRLHYLSMILRRLCFAFHERGYGDVLDGELLRRYPSDQKMVNTIVGNRRRWRSSHDASRILQSSGVDDRRRRVVNAFLSGRKALETIAADTSLTSAEKAELMIYLGMTGHDDLIDKVKAGCDVDQTPEGDGELLVTVGLAANRPELVRDALITNLSRLRRHLEKLGKRTRARTRAYYKPLEIFNQIVAAWPILSEQDRSSAISLYGMMFENRGSVGVLSGAYYFLLSQAGRAREIPLPIIKECVRNWSLEPKHSAGIINAWVRQTPPAKRVVEMKKLINTIDPKRREWVVSKLVGYLEPKLLDQLAKHIPELAAKRQPEEKIIDLAAKRAEFHKTIMDTRKRMNTDIRQVFSLNDRVLRPAANMLPPKELDMILKDLVNSRDPFNRLMAFLLLRQAGRDVEALAVMNDIAAMNPQDPTVEAAQSALPRILLSNGWNLQAARMMPEGSVHSGGNIALACLLHDPLAILANRAGDRLTVSERRVHATRFMASPEQYLQAARIYFADTRHPDVVHNHRLWWRTRTWPKGIPETAGGLVALGPGTGNILEPVAAKHAGQDELGNWLKAISTRNAHEDGIATAVAGSVTQSGLSPKLKQILESAASESVLNRADIDLIVAMAKQAPEHLPNSLSGQMLSIALSDRKRESHRIAALAEACKRFERMDLARALSRWAVTKDLMTSGASDHLSAYLETVPKAERKKVLTQLLPFMGITEVRVVTGSNMGSVLAALLDNGMAAEASKIVNRYLRLRLNLSRPQPHFYNSNGYKKMVPGIGSDLDGQDDAMAVALARLNRLGDYERLLRKKGMGAKLPWNPYDKSIKFPTIELMNNIAALPEPGQVKDVTPYVDVQLKLANGFRREGKLSREGQVAGICLLGRWCADHGLEARAAALLKQADTMSRGMLSARLWVADLNRILGKDQAAEAIELKLLGHDLLPMARVPAALKALTRTKGQTAADAVAYRLARYTNHPKILPYALRHAGARKMRTAYLDIAERIRKVNTLFLPPGTKPKFDGYGSEAEWSTAIATAAAQMPDDSKLTGLARLVHDEHRDIAKVEVVGRNPKVIYVPILHDGPFSHISSNGTGSIEFVLDRCKALANHLYKEYNVRNLVLEGLGKKFVDRYNKIPVDRRKVSGKPHKMAVFRAWVAMLAHKEWNLVPAANRPMTGPLTALGYKYGNQIHAALADAKKNGWFKTQEGFNENRAQLQKKLDAIARAYNKEFDVILKQDPGLKHEYAITVTHRNKAFLDNLRAVAGPGIVFFGAAHWQDLKDQLTKSKTPYALVVPKGLQWPPTHKDAATVYADMLKLGCQLHKVTIKFGDGGQVELKIPLRSPLEAPPLPMKAQ